MKLEAIRNAPFRYAGKDQRRGDVFEASDKDGRLFKDLHWAVDAGGKKTSSVDLPAQIMSRALKAQEPVVAVVAKEPEEPTTPLRRYRCRYRRRDLTAE